MRSIIAAVALVACPAQLVWAQAPWCAPPATRTTFTGSVRHGEAFERPFGRNLAFRLAPSRDPSVPGWTIEVRRRGDTNPERELSWLATPPYRGWNPRHLTPSHGHSMDEALALTPRHFEFLANAEDFERASNAVERLLWPANATNADLDAAGATLESVRKGEGRVHIETAERRQGEDRDRIDTLSFRVELCER